jgi:hypothetical protein
MSAKMQHIVDELNKKLEGKLPYYSAYATDNLCSAVHIKGAVSHVIPDDPVSWHNAKNFSINIFPVDKEYTVDGNIVAEAYVTRSGLLKYRKTTGSIKKVVDSIVKYFDRIKHVV